LQGGKFFDKTGYPDEMDIEIIDGDSFHVWTGNIYEDNSRFSAVIKALATALEEVGIILRLGARGLRFGKLVEKSLINYRMYVSIIFSAKGISAGRRSYSSSA